MKTFSIDTFIEEANRIKSSEDAAALFGEALKHLGYDRFCYSLITDHPSLGLKAGHAVVSNYPDDWMKHYKANHYETKDPVPRYGVFATRPFTWDSLSHTYDLKPEQKKVMNEAKEARLLDGIAIPICGRNGELAGIGMASSAGGIKPDRPLLRKIQALAFQFHLTYTELEKKLSPNTNDIA